MTVLDEITQMKNQGVDEREIINNLKEKGVTPKEINDALDQANIKNAVAKEPQGGAQEQDVYNPQAPEEYDQNYAPQTQENYPPQEQGDYQQEGGYYPPQENQDYGYSQGVDTDTIMEISEHVFVEKMKDIQKQVEMMNEFKNINQSKVENIEERLKRIESTIDKLQSAILEKIGEYGNNLDSIKKEMSMMQDSFGKAMGKQSSPSITKTSSAPTTKKKVVKK